MKVAIIGGGIGGLAAASALQSRGADVDVYEQAPNLAEVGAGVQMTPNATKVLRALGVEERLARDGFLPDAIVGLDWKSGRTTFRTPLKEVCPKLYGADYYQIHRADLHQMLRDSVPADRIHLGTRCTGVIMNDGRGVARFEDGSEIEADVIVGADGIHSAVRRSLFEDVRPKYTGNMCWRALVPVDRPDPQLTRLSSSMWFGPKGHVVVYYVKGGRAINIVACLEVDSWAEESWTLPSSREELCAAYAEWNPALLRLLEKTTNVFKWGLFDHDPMQGWSRGNVTLLGDAAHPMLPYLSQGAAMGIEDGWVLARALTETGVDVATALQIYEAARLPRTRDVQLGARARARSYHLTSPFARLKRDVAHFLRGLVNPHAAGMQTAWVYDYDATAVTLPALRIAA